jgi:hypothetical protein
MWVTALAAMHVPVMAQPKPDPADVKFRRSEALTYAHALGDRFQKFHDALVAADALTGLAGAICHYDRAFAETLFNKASNTLSGSWPQTGPAIAKYRGTRSSLIARAASCDSAMAKKLNIAANSDSAARRAAAIESASTALKEDPQAAAGLLGGVAGSQITQEDLRTIVTLLWRLRAKGATQQADNLFLSQVAYVASMATFEPFNFSMLGNYLFAPPGQAMTMQFVILAGVPIISLSGDRPGLNAETVRTYLETAVALLSRPWLDAAADATGDEPGFPSPNDTASRYILAYQLLPKAQEFEPALVPLFQSLLDQLASKVPAGVSNPDSYSTLARSMQESQTSEEQALEESKDPARQDDIALSLIFTFWYKDDVKPMREIVSKIHDSDLKSKLDALVTYAEASQAIAGSPQTAARLASSIPPDAKRALVHLRLADAAKSDPFVARQFLDSMLREAREIPVKVRSDLLLGTARQMASMDFSYACRILVDVVDSFNELDGGKPRTSESEMEEQQRWNETVESSGVKETFNILLGTSESLVDRKESITRLAAIDPGRVEHVLELLHDEKRQAAALSLVAGVRLDQAFQSRR